MSDKVLFVDDDPNLLTACERCFRKHFKLDIADGGKAGLAKISERGPYAVVVSDRQMPGMDGIEFLAAVKNIAPDTVRMMLTGNVDLEAAVRVVNEGNIFRFLIKPCPQDILRKAIEDAQTQYRLVTAEKELLTKTLSGSIRLLTEILSTIDAKLVSKGGRLQGPAKDVIDTLAADDAWEVHLAAMLAPIGYVTLPPEILVRARETHALSKVEEQLISSVPEIAARLLANIPRLEGVARIVRYQQKRFDGSGFPPDTIHGDAIPRGARLLKILTDMLQLQSEGMSYLEALDLMQPRQGWYDPQILGEVRVCFGGKAPEPAKPALSVTAKELAPGMLLRSDITTRDGTLVLASGNQINDTTVEKIRNFDRISGINEPILVEAVSL